MSSLERLHAGDRLPVPGNGMVVARMRVVTPSDAPLLSEWREHAKHWFMTEFEPSAARTQAWIGERANDPRAILLVVELLQGSPIGHLGLREIDIEQGSAEVDNVLRGEQTGLGLMREAMAELVDWANRELGIQHLTLHVFQDNPAIDFYEGLGFCPEGEPEGLAFQRSPGGGVWLKSSRAAERFLITMSREAPAHVEPA